MGIVIVGAAVSLLCVGVHYEALIAAARWPRRAALPPRLRVAFGIVIALLAHALESAIFAGGWWLLVKAGGARLTIAEPAWQDLLYFSMACYTSLGFGDIVALGPGRLLSGFEAILGLVMIAWTASFTYFEMHRDWQPEFLDTD